MPFAIIATMVNQVTRRAFLGTGLIGTGMAEAALERGDDVLVWNRTVEKTEPLVEAGATLLERPQDAHAAEVVHLALTSDHAVDATLAQLLEGRKPEARQIIVDHSTCSADGTAERQTRLSNAGIDFLSAPVFMSPAACRACTGVMLVGGDEACFVRAKAALEVMTGKLLFVGEAPGRAATTKLVGNGMILSLVGALADTFTVGAPHGVSPNDVLRLFEVFDLNYIFSGRGARMAEGNFETSWTLEMARKDLGLMLDAADGAPLSVLRSLASRADELIEAGRGQEDVGVLAAHAVNVKSPT